MPFFFIAAPFDFRHTAPAVVDFCQFGQTADIHQFSDVPIN